MTGVFTTGCGWPKCIFLCNELTKSKSKYITYLSPTCSLGFAHSVAVPITIGIGVPEMISKVSKGKRELGHKYFTTVFSYIFYFLQALGYGLLE